MASFFAGIDKVQASTFERIPYIEDPGHFDVKVTSAKAGYSENPKRMGQPYIRAEFEVITVHDGAYKVGDKLAFWRACQGENNLIDIKAFCAAAAGVNQSEITPDMADALFADNGVALVGETLTVRAVPNRKGTVNPKTGKIYVNEYFSPLNNADVDAGF